MLTRILHLLLIITVLLPALPASRAHAQDGSEPEPLAFPELCGCFHVNMSGVYPITFDTCDGENFFTPGVLDTRTLNEGRVHNVCVRFTNLVAGRYDERGMFGILDYDSLSVIDSCDACGEGGACSRSYSEVQNARGDRIHTLAIPIRWQGELYEVHLLSDNPSLVFEAKSLANAGAGWAKQKGVTGLLVTRGEEIVTAPQTVREVLLALNAAYHLYVYKPQVPLPSLDSEYDVALDGLRGAFLGAMSPVAKWRFDSHVLEDTLQQVLQDQVAGAALEKRLNEAMTDDAAPVEQLAQEATGVALELLDAQKYPGLEQEVGQVIAELKDADKVVKGARIVTVIVKLLVMIDLQVERAEWLAAYMDAFPDETGALSTKQTQAAFTVLAEVDDLKIHRVNDVVRVLVETVGDLLVDGGGKLPAWAVKQLGSKYSASLLGSLAATVPAAFSVNGALYGTDELIADFRIGREAEALRRVFAVGREQLTAEAKAAFAAEKVYDGDLAEQYRTAYLLETAAAALSHRLYGKGYQAIYLLPNFSMALDLLQGGIRREAAEAMVTNADTVEREALATMNAPAFLAEALALAASTCAPQRAAGQTAGRLSNYPGMVEITVLVDKLNVRSGPSRNDSVVAQVNIGDVLQVIMAPSGSEWLMVCCINEYPAWVFNSPEYFRITPEDGLAQLEPLD